MSVRVGSPCSIQPCRLCKCVLHSLTSFIGLEYCSSPSIHVPILCVMHHLPPCTSSPCESCQKGPLSVISSLSLAWHAHVVRIRQQAHAKHLLQSSHILLAHLAVGVPQDQSLRPPRPRPGVTGGLGVRPRGGSITLSIATTVCCKQKQAACKYTAVNSS